MKLGNGEGRSQNPLWRICRHLGSFTVGGSPKELVELGDEQLVSSGQVVPEDEDHEQGHDGHQLFRTGGAVGQSIT